MTNTVLSQSVNPHEKFLIDVYTRGITPDVGEKLKSLRNEQMQLTDQQIIDLVLNATGSDQPA